MKFCVDLPLVSLFMANMEQYTTLYVNTDIIQNQLVGDAKASLIL